MMRRITATLSALAGRLYGRLVRRGEALETPTVPPPADGVHRVLTLNTEAEFIPSGDEVHVVFSVDIDSLPLVIRMATPLGYLELERDILWNVAATGAAARRGRIDFRADSESVTITALANFQSAPFRVDREEIIDYLEWLEVAAPIDDTDYLDAEYATLEEG